ncbi:hypothetical protein ACJ2A9_12540 [Anaerobacillus sp. MEB173]|uniref:hypothetical protein n=1 Tax=Anaerobacillus sp. MEB173 TaxID=3383345 RepID=UPI003F919045
MFHILISSIILLILLLCAFLLIPFSLHKKIKWISFGGTVIAAYAALFIYIFYNVWLSIIVLFLLLTLTVLYVRQQLLTSPIVSASDESNEDYIEDSEFEQTVKDSEPNNEEAEALSFSDVKLNQDSIDEHVEALLEGKEKNEKDSLEHDLTHSKEPTDNDKDEVKAQEIDVEEGLLSDRSQLEAIEEKEINDEQELLASRKWMLADIIGDNESEEKESLKFMESENVDFKEDHELKEENSNKLKKEKSSLQTLEDINIHDSKD